jgi:hypothetical protein
MTAPTSAIFGQRAAGLQTSGKFIGYRGLGRDDKDNAQRQAR